MSEQIVPRSTSAKAWIGKTTDKGDALIAKMVAGSTLEITRAQTGSGTVDVSLLKSQTEVSSLQQEARLQPVAYPEKKICKLPVTITNDGLLTSYTAMQIGVYANDPDEGEVLFFLAQADGKGTFVESETRHPNYSADFDFYVGIGDADSVSVNIDPSNSVTHEGMENYVNTTIVAYQEAILTGGTGAAYTARVPGITELKPGVSFIMRPHAQSTTDSPTLNVNGLGAKPIRQPLTTNTGATTTPASASWLLFAKPVRVMYDGAQWVIDRPRPSATNLYGQVAIRNGGTGADNTADARKNLHVAPATESEDFPGCYYRTVDGETEWINPPMWGNSEYRTTERHLGAPVYTKQISLVFAAGNVPSGNLWTQFVSIDGAKLLWVESVRFTTGDGVLDDISKAGSLVSYSLAPGEISITCDLRNSNIQRVTVYARVKYTK